MATKIEEAALKSWVRRFTRRCAVSVAALAVLGTGVVPSASAVQSFDNALIADKGLAELGTSRPTGWDQPGECVKSVQRWVAAAGGSFPSGGGVIGGYTAAGAAPVTLAQAVKGDVVQPNLTRAQTPSSAAGDQCVRQSRRRATAAGISVSPMLPYPRTRARSGVRVTR
ncbi:hypothetical protein SUDANB95_02670 [Actinosynnema sp. ALI-1.44]